MNRSIILQVAAAAMLLSTPVLAQSVQPSPDGYAPAASGDFEHGRGMAAHLRHLHDRLGITPAQQPQWDAVMATLRDNAQAMRASPAVQALRSGQLDAVQALRASADLARQRADNMGRLVPAMEALYTALSPQQRQVADQEMQQLVRRGEHHRG